MLLPSILLLLTSFLLPLSALPWRYGVCINIFCRRTKVRDCRHKDQAETRSLEVIRLPFTCARTARAMTMTA